jgi:hypothetical protein
MTLREVLGVLGRRWYVLLAAVLVAVGAFFAWHRAGGVWVATPVVTFLSPGSHILMPENGLKDQNIISFASTVAQEINNGHDPESFAADDAPLYGAGLRQGVRVSVPNVGGQWSTSYSDAEIIMQIVSTDKAWVEATQSRLLANVDLIAAAAQRENGIGADEQIVTNVMPLSTQVSRVTSGRSTTVEALAALLFAAFLAGGWASVAVDRALARPRRPRAARRESPVAPRLQNGAPA